MIKTVEGFRERAVDYARELVGTPFKHQGRDYHDGVDCIGTVVLSLMRAGWFPSHPETALRTDYGRDPDWQVLNAAIEPETTRIPLDWAKPADILLMCWKHRIPQHMALVSRKTDEGLYVIHTHATQSCVTEHFLSDDYYPKIWGAFRLKELA